MRIIANESSYDTRAVRRVLQAVARVFVAHEDPIYWDKVCVQLLKARTQHIRVRAWMDLRMEVFRMDVYLPPLLGTEFIGLARQQHGGPMDVDHGGLYAKKLALTVQSAMYALHTKKRRSWHSKVLMDERRMMRGIPTLVPLRIIKPSQPRDKLREKLVRTLELKKGWQRKAKLAGTKLKKLSSLQRRYEKQLAQREATA